MTADHSFVVGPGHVHGPSSSLVDTARSFGVAVDSIHEFRLAHVRGDVDAAALAVLGDALLADARLALDGGGVEEDVGDPRAAAAAAWLQAPAGVQPRNWMLRSCMAITRAS